MKRQHAREALLVLFAIAVSALLFRAQISTALMLRGDDLLARGDAAGAQGKYEWALRFDSSNGAALDRVLFAALERRDAGARQMVLQRADSYLRRHPGDAAVLQDRALCELLLHERVRAAGDLERAARTARDAQLAAFAAIARGAR